MEKDLIEFLEKMSDKIGTTGAQLYKVLVRQAKIDAVTSIIKLVLIIFFALILLRAWQHLLPYCKPENPKGEYSYDREWPGEIQACFVILCVISAVTLLVTIIQTSDVLDTSVKGFLNPEAAALESIMEMKK